MSCINNRSRDELAEIRERLKDKNIYLIPYCHADHAWMHSRDWHIRRYDAVMRRALELLAALPELKYFIDSWSELLKPCVERHPEWIPLIREYLREGRLAFGAGQWSNIRFSHLGDESAIRNIVYGRRRVAELFPEAGFDVYANLDVGIGHSQVPQFLTLAGCRYYFAWRPQHGLDEQGVPRSFIWQGLSGDRVTVTRHGYGGWFHAEEFYDKNGNPCDFANKAVEMDFVIRYAWEHYLKVPCSQPGLKTLSFNQGGDDNIPHVDAMYGFERDIPAIIKQWNDGGFGHLQYGTPQDVFAEISMQELPVREELLDPAELCYNIARNGARSAWRYRDFIDREFCLTEFFAARAAASDIFPYPTEKLKELWEKFLPWTTHAIEFLFKDDLREVFLDFETCLAEAVKLRRQILTGQLDESDENDPSAFTIFNPLPEARREIVELDIPNIYNHRRCPELRSLDGRTLPQQVVVVGTLARFFHVLVEVELPPGAATQVGVGWRKEDVELPSKQVGDNLNIELVGDQMTLIFKSGRLVKIVNRETGNTLTAPAENGFIEPRSLPQDVPPPGWMAKSFAEKPLPFEVESIEIAEHGPLRHRLVRTGKSGPHHFRQEIDLYRGETRIRVKTIADIVPDSTNIVLANPLPTDAALTVDIPFGVEERDVGKIKYGFQGGGNYENVERRIPGIFWGRSWIHVAAKESFGLISLDGARYYRDHGTPRQLLHFLACVKPYREEGWLQFVDTQRVLGRNEFNHVLVCDGSDYRSADMVQQSQALRTAIPFMPGRITAAAAAPFEITPDVVRLNAFYREKETYLLRMTNMSPEPVTTNVLLPFCPTTAELCDFFGNPLPNAAPITIDKNRVGITLTPWQIATVKLFPKG